MPLQCFPPLHIAKKWLEASSFCTVGCWPEPEAECQSRRTCCDPAWPVRGRCVSQRPLAGAELLLRGCDGMLFGHLPGQLRAAAAMVGKRIVFSCSGGTSVSGAAANEQKAAALTNLWLQGLLTAPRG